MKTLVCFISHVVNDALIDHFLKLKDALDDKYDIKYISPNKYISDFRIKDYIVNLDIRENMIDYYNDNNVKSHLYYIYTFYKFKNYDNYWFIENDVTINNNNLTEGWRNLFKYYDNNDSDLICSKIHKWTDCKGYQLRYPKSLLNKYINNQLTCIDVDKLWFVFLSISRLSNKLLSLIINYYEKYDGYFEYVFTSLAYINNLKISSLTDDKFDIEDVNSINEFNQINLGSNTYNLAYINNYMKRNIPKNIIIHPIKLY